MGSDLDDEYGQPAGKYSYGDRDLDPTHLRAMASRIDGFADLLQEVRNGGHRRDDVIAEIKRNVAAIRIEVDLLLKATTQFTDEQVKTLRDIVLGKSRRDWLIDRVKLFAFYAVTTLGAVLTIVNLFPAASRFVKGLLP